MIPLPSASSPFPPIFRDPSLFPVLVGPFAINLDFRVPTAVGSSGQLVPDQDDGSVKRRTNEPQASNGRYRPR
ncbi:hypothetical protein P175DRAFT_0501558 [Aspergillus ochraceoroseus IBT 24754]|uniref:Uncharacterized protein n=1 Tax=Aspergillus ochraceoroseus IBT 24754 TaxID=1392256 RepID=A0A2T5LXB0_9EURO|nr:uncharacterized protein P175DRAFT_0501558 [Aspergillus ochraceoroseus IBT 24754]PTU20928.1 hypothetical protein P175DRAFT_0501558 [Aspergillus ochraceoroseus IBT 24754]